MTTARQAPGTDPLSGFPLAGVRVLDVTHVGAGPLCGSLLGQLGADVIKVEPLGTGELVRTTEPYIGESGVSYYFSSVNSQKRYVQIDLKSAEGKQLFERIAERCDVVVTNMGPGAMTRLGLDGKCLRRLNGGLIYCQIAGFRPGSAYEDMPSFDYVHEAMSGVMSITRESGEVPPLPGLPAADMSGGIYAVLSVLIALRQRDATGEGQDIVVPLHDCLLSMMPLRLSYSFLHHEPLEPYGRFQRDFAPFGVFETSDGQIVMAVGSQPLWRRLVAVIPVLDEEQFDTPLLRVENRADLLSKMAIVLKTKSTDQWMREFRAAKVPAGPVLDTKEVVEDPYIEGVSVSMRREGDVFNWLKYPVLHSTFDATITKPTTRPGVHTREVLQEVLDLTAEECQNLAERGVTNA
jgi:crotonobetainyl-CoA:carnitine CoA-transferase CaiB-like acyl-CoA transferase